MIAVNVAVLPRCYLKAWTIVPEPALVLAPVRENRGVKMKVLKKVGFALAAGAIALMAGAGVPSKAADLSEPGGVYNPWQDMSWLIRGRAIGVIPDENDGRLAGAGAAFSVDNSVMPELDISYFLTDNIALELILAVSPHDVSLTGAGKVTELLLLPPTLTLQYHQAFGAFKPYVGVGLNYTVILDSDATGAIGGIDRWDDSLGVALQVGFDYAINDNWSVNLDVKKLFLNLDGDLTAARVNASVDVDPWIIGGGIGYRF